ncbi:hypothetical protein [Corynebacterium aquatimens]|uniref:Uncharacterized protein n=1 Tax=Corynebacterium aquatimens TaxID=1190508 RepID=A0A931E4S6_9CORY|nr:hypothetical protein [Corynebacterium aquatimens]MBG6122448.1 hypothetical protein [Corynebacterium aquatimens]WJY65012.1 hypothetical protein CAQUA_01365 [Corynebacterium aquatimens]
MSYYLASAGNGGAELAFVLFFPFVLMPLIVGLAVAFLRYLNTNAPQSELWKSAGIGAAIGVITLMLFTAAFLLQEKNPFPGSIEIGTALFFVSCALYIALSWWGGRVTGKNQKYPPDPFDVANAQAGAPGVGMNPQVLPPQAVPQPGMPPQAPPIQQPTIGQRPPTPRTWSTALALSTTASSAAATTFLVVNALLLDSAPSTDGGEAAYGYLMLFGPGFLWTAALPAALVPAAIGIMTARPPKAR